MSVIVLSEASCLVNDIVKKFFRLWSAFLIRTKITLHARALFKNVDMSNMIKDICVCKPLCIYVTWKLMMSCREVVTAVTDILSVILKLYEIVAV